MSTYKITAPNGQTYQIQGPEGATDEQIRAEVLRQFPDADPTLKQYPDTARGPDIAAEPRSTTADLATGTQNAVAGAAQGAAGVYDFPMQVANTVQRGVNYALGEGGGALMDMVGLEGAADTWRGAANKADATLANIGSVSDVIEQVSPTPEGMGGARFLSQLAGGVAVPIGPKAAPRAPRAPAPSTANPAHDVIQAGQDHGVRVMTSDVSPPRSFVTKNIQAMGERIPIAGTGGPRVAQQGERVEAVKQLANDYGADVSIDILDEVSEDLAKTRGAELTRHTTAKNSVIQGVQAPFTQAPRTAHAIDMQIARLRGIDEVEYAPVIQRLERFKGNLTSGKTLEQVDGNRKLLGEMFADPKLAGIKTEGQKSINAIYNPLREDMGVFISKNAPKENYQKWVRSNDRLAAMAGELKSNTFKSVLNDAETTPENVAKLLFSNKPSEVRRLVGSLSPEGRKKAQAAIITRALEKAGDDVSPDKFANETTRLGKSIGVVFEGQDLARIIGLQKVLQATKRASQAAAAPPTGVQNSMATGGFAAGSIAGWAAIPWLGAAGGMARLYESAAVRNLLVGLGRAKPGTPGESQIMERIGKVVTSQSEIQSGGVTRAANDQVGALAAAGETEEQ